MDERRTGKAPFGQLEVVILPQVSGPEDLATGFVESEDMPHFAEGKNATVMDGGRGAGAALVVTGLQVARVGMSPDGFSGGRIKTEDRIDIVFIAHGEDPPVMDGDRREPGPDLGGPSRSGLLIRPGIEPTGFPRNAIMIGPAPLRPIVRPESQRKEPDGDRCYREDNAARSRKGVGKAGLPDHTETLGKGLGECKENHPTMARRISSDP